jgi:hypothetical protein
LGNLLAQCLPGALRGGGGFILGGNASGGNDARRFGTGIIDQLRCLFFGATAKLGGGLARMAQLLTSPFFGQRQIGLGLVRGGQTIGDLACPLVERLHDRRPHEFHREPREHEEYRQLGKQRCVQIHVGNP